MRVALAQINPTVGKIQSNRDLIIDYIKKAKESEVDVVVFPELSLTGYPPEDLLYKTAFLNKCYEALEEIKSYTKDIVVIVGFVHFDEDLYNSAAVICNGEIQGVYNKRHLPNYGVFDEKRYFQKGNEYLLITINGVKTGINICEDLWYPSGPSFDLGLLGCKVIFNLNASPYSRKKESVRDELLKVRGRDNNTIICYSNLVGGQDELVFDGRSRIVDANGDLLGKAKAFEEELLVVDINTEHVVKKQLKSYVGKTEKSRVKDLEFQEITIELNKIKKESIGGENPVEYTEEESVYLALKTGLKDYILKNGFKKVVLGLSGGVDSALVAVIAKEALGSENVKGVLMSSPYTSRASVDDALALAKNLEIETIELPIANAMESYTESLSEVFKDEKEDVTEENLQARIRGNLLMALSNKFGWIVIATGNKSEMSVGYSTLYGDLAGGFALIKDVPKTLVYRVCDYINREKEIIPVNILTKAPSAELREDQRDQDDLPSYEIIDKIIEYYIEEDFSVEEISNLGLEKKIVQKIVRMIDINEYKRRQAPIGIKITEKAFGKERRMPITNGFRES